MARYSADPHYYDDPTDYAIANGTWYDDNGIDPDGYDRDGVYIGDEFYGEDDDDYE